MPTTDARASVTYNVTSSKGYGLLLTVRRDDEAELFELMKDIESFLIKEGYTPEVKKSFGGAKPIETTDEKCPKCSNPLVKITTKDGKQAYKCSTSRWDYATKTSSGCDYFKYLDAPVDDEPASPKQKELLMDKGLWEDKMTKAQATELISKTLSK
jgi:hypothetical protein